MNRNTESHFSLMPTANISRSRFDRSFSHKTSFDAGDVVPFYLEEVLPGDTFNVKTSKVVRMPTLLTPIMDNIYLDTYYFFVPNRLVWDHWKEFCGENTESAWIPQTEYTIPQLTAPADTGWDSNTIADYFGVPTGVAGISVNALPFRAYALIMNEWFRDQNLRDPVVISTGDETIAGTNTSGLDTYARGGRPYTAAKYHDYFTSCLPAPQKGPDVTIGLGGSQIPVFATSDVVPDYADSVALSGIAYDTAYGVQSSPTSSTVVSAKLSENAYLSGDTASFIPNNLWAIPTSDGGSMTINQLRMAFQIQKFYELQARGGSRYTEVVRSFFGVVSPDARLQRPEYLGGNRIPINVNQVVQQSGTEATSTPQGTVTGMSQTTDTHSDFTKSFTEHGFIIGVMVARFDHTYQQGLNRMWSRRDKFDYYWPVFANIGEMAVLNKEIYCDGSSTDDEVFGYQEAWADYRYKPSYVSGHMRSNLREGGKVGSLDVWHLADYYSRLPRLSSAWIGEDYEVIDRVLSVTTAARVNQFFADIYVQNYCTRPMPMYSIPGLADHH